MSYAYHARVFSPEGCIRGEAYESRLSEAYMWANLVGIPGDTTSIHLAYECADGFEDFELEEKFLVREQ